MKVGAVSLLVISLGVGSLIVGGTVDARTPAPTAGDLQIAEDTTDALANALVAAVVSISDATPPGSSPETIHANSAAISILLPSCQNKVGLLDATGNPINPRNTPHGNFEESAMRDLVQGAPIVQELGGNSLRTMLPLTNDMHPNCASCHSNYAALPPGTVVGAAAFKVRL